MFSFKSQSTNAARLPFLQYVVTLAMVNAVKSIHPKVRIFLDALRNAGCLKFCDFLG